MREMGGVGCFSRKAAEWDSPGKRPGNAPIFYQALKGRNSGCCAPSGLGMFFIVETRAMP